MEHFRNICDAYGIEGDAKSFCIDRFKIVQPIMKNHNLHLHVHSLLSWWGMPVILPVKSNVYRQRLNTATLSGQELDLFLAPIFQ